MTGKIGQPAEKTSTDQGSVWHFVSPMVSIVSKIEL